MEEEIKKLKQEGFTIRQIADKLQIGRDKVHRLLKSDNTKEIGQSDKEQIKKSDSKTEHKKIKINYDGSYYDENGVYHLANGRTIGEDIFIFN